MCSKLPTTRDNMIIRIITLENILLEILRRVVNHLILYLLKIH